MDTLIQISAQLSSAALLQKLKSDILVVYAFKSRYY